ncbi:bacterio-opsin activator domain-containing protein [Halovivax gelatinilyticus]|uniref:bacterio-opsin activator domain-containing protein n=1 Tax=Halovivax gelatinilyticus TaxID=2961597 RepID=UPI0020CA3213|nr:bacterio-opsin activator domain-containing protein [Halovivax gelatinilyticus]
MDLAPDRARLALDNVPLNVALLDETGTIRASNASWKRFGRANDIQTAPDAVGENYLEITRRADDRYADAAADGIEAVLSGERVTFSLEYPCHSPDERRWFLMHAGGVTADDTRYAIVAHQNITERREAEREARREHERLAHLVDRLSGLVRDVTDELLGASTREAVERILCRRLVETDAYDAAWVGRTTLGTDRLAVTAVAGDAFVDRTDEASVIELRDGHPLADVANGRTPLDVRARDAGGSNARWQTVTTSLLDSEATTEAVAEALPAGGLVAVAIGTDETCYGVLVAYAAEGTLPADPELAVLESIGATAGAVVDAIERRRWLVDDGVTELGVTIADPAFVFVRLADAIAGELTYLGATYRADGSLLAFVAADADESAMTDAIGPVESIASVTSLGGGDEARFQLRLTETDLVDALGDRGGTIRRLVATPDRATVTIDVAPGSPPRAVHDVLTARYDAVDVRHFHERTSPATRSTFVQTLTDQLTERQREAIQTAYLAGFYDEPRAATGDDLAESMDISRATFHQHRRAAERTLLGALFEDTHTDAPDRT